MSTQPVFRNMFLRQCLHSGRRDLSLDVEDLQSNTIPGSAVPHCFNTSSQRSKFRNNQRSRSSLSTRLRKLAFNFRLFVSNIQIAVMTCSKSSRRYLQHPWVDLSKGCLLDGLRDAFPEFILGRMSEDIFRLGRNPCVRRRDRECR